MAKIYGEELKRAIMKQRETLQAAIDRRAERIANWETDEDDCFMSERVEQNGIRECDLQLDILSGDGCMDLDAWFDTDGNEVRVRCVKTRYGWAYVWNGVFASSEKALAKKTGLTRKTIRVPIWTKFSTPYSGMMGAYCGSYEVVRWHTNMVTGEYVGYPD